MKKSYTLFIYIAIILLMGFTACDDGNDFGSGYIPSLQKSEVTPVTYHTTVSLTNLMFAAAASSNMITVNSNEEWTATSSDTSWCTVSPSSGSKVGSVNVSVTENTFTSLRSATITIKGQSSGDEIIVTVKQNPPTKPEYNTTTAVATLEFKADATDSPQDIAITSNEEWTATSSNTSWCTVSPASGNNNKTVTVTVTKNTSLSQRDVTITIKGKTSGKETKVTIKQVGVSSVTTAAPASLEFKAEATDSPKSITVTSNEEWTATSSETSWCTVSPTSGRGSGTVKVTVTKNTALSQRNATIIIKGKTSGDETKITVTQEGISPFTTATPTSLTFNAQATDSPKSITVTSNEEWTVEYHQLTAIGEKSWPEWCTVSPLTGSDNGTVDVTIKESTLSFQRHATITIKGKTSGVEITIKVTQDGIPVPNEDDNYTPVAPSRKSN